MTIGLRALGSASRFDIRLDPVELGRIDVALDIDRDRGTVGARLVVDRPETLQQALSQTGLDASAGITLSLRDGGGDQRRHNETGGQSPRGPVRDGAANPRTTTDPSGRDAAPLRILRGHSGLDIRI